MSDTPKPKAFQLYIDNKPMFDNLTNEQAGEVIKTLFCFVYDGTAPEKFDSQIVKLVFEQLIQRIKSDFEQYALRVEKNRSNGAKGAAMRINKQANGSDCLNNQALGSVRLQKNKKEKNKTEENKKEDKYNTSVPLRNGTSAKFDYQSVIDSFNSICVSLPKVQRLTDKRKRQIKAAAETLGDMSFSDLFQQVEKSDFLSGRSGKWNGCCFDWILNNSNLTKIIEGNYSKRTAQPPKKHYDEEL